MNRYPNLYNLSIMATLALFLHRSQCPDPHRASICRYCIAANAGRHHSDAPPGTLTFQDALKLAQRTAPCIAQQ